MKYICILCLFFFLPKVFYAQLVTTIAGLVETVGEADGPAFEARFNNPHGIAVDQEGNIYISDRFGHKIRKLSIDGMVSTLAGSGLVGSDDGVGENASFNEPWGLCVGTDGHIYVADTRNNLIRKITPSGIVTTYAGSGNFGTTDGIGLSATFGNPSGIEMDDSGNLYIADHLTHIIRKIEPSGQVSTLAGLPYTPGALDGTGSSALFYRPYGLTIDNQGNLLVADEWNHRIRMITPAGEVTTIAGSGTIGHINSIGTGAAFNYPWDLTVDSLDNIFVVDGYNQVIRKLAPSGTIPLNYTVSTYAGTVGISGGQDGYGVLASFNGATGLAYLKEKGEIYVADAYNNLIRKITGFAQQNVALVVSNQGSNSFCQGEVVNLNAIPDNFQSYSFYVDNQIAQTSDSPDFTLSDLLPGSYTLQVIASDGGGTYESDVLIIDVLPPPVPTITIIGSATFFEGDSVILVASNASEYLWSNGDVTPAITVEEGGFYTVEIVDANGCSGISDAVEIEVFNFSTPPAIVFIQGDEILCYNETAILESSYDTENQWFLDGWPISGETGRTLQVAVSGNYQVQITDSLGFVLLSNGIDIEVLPPLLEDFSADLLTLTEDDNRVQFSSVANDTVSYQWNFGDPASGPDNYSQEANPGHQFELPGNYTIQLVVRAGDTCTDTLFKENYIEFQSLEIGDILYIPNAFTPNGDDVNDVFYVRGEIEKLELYIYDQWGSEVFSTNAPDEGWNGTRFGRKVQNGTYLYIAKIEMQSGLSLMRRGHVSCIR